jgi:hypothetical protein
MAVSRDNRPLPLPHVADPEKDGHVDRPTNEETDMSQPGDRSGDDMYDNSVTGARARGVGRLLGDASEPDEEATAIAEEGDDAEDDANLSAEEQAMHLTRAPSFGKDDGYIAD